MKTVFAVIGVATLVVILWDPIAWLWSLVVALPQLWRQLAKERREERQVIDAIERDVRQTRPRR